MATRVFRRVWKRNSQFRKLPFGAIFTTGGLGPYLKNSRKGYLTVAEGVEATGQITPGTTATVGINPVNGTEPPTDAEV